MVTALTAGQSQTNLLLNKDSAGKKTSKGAMTRSNPWFHIQTLASLHRKAVINTIKGGLKGINIQQVTPFALWSLLYIEQSPTPFITPSKASCLSYSAK